jgi:hypothetical protein
MAISKEQAKEEIQRIINKYEKLKSEGKIKQYNEEATKQGFILPLFHALGWEVEDTEEVYPESKVSKGRVDYSFKSGGITKFFLEAKKLSENLDDSRWSSQAISYAWHKGVAWSVLCDFEGLKVFNAEYKIDNPVLFDLTYDKYLSNFEQLWLLSKESFLNKSIDLEAEKWKKKPKREKIDKALFEDLTKWRNSLLSSIRKSDSSITEEQADEAIQRIIDRLIFIRVCEDRELEDPRLLATAREDRGTTLKQLLQLFAYYKHKYNSKLFDEHLADQVKIDDNILVKIIDDLTGSKEAFIKYDFNAINADVLGIIYEQYLGYILKKVGKGVKATKGKAHRKEMGIYYTPTYIVDYIVKNTVKEYCKDKTLEQISNIKILDPACGSGSFLIKAFDELVAIIKERIKRGEKTKLFDELTPDGELLLGQKIQIACRNIYGVDLDSKAVEIAQLSILLKLLENEGKDHKGGKLLPTILNIKCGNSLIDDPAIAGDKAFKWEEQFDYVFKEGGFDVIVGNPPYIQMQKVKPTEKHFIEKAFPEVSESQNDLWYYFAYRSITLLKNLGRLGFITSRYFLEAAHAKKLRKIILGNTKIKQIVDFKGLNVFEGIGTHTTIFILEKDYDPSKRLRNKINVSTTSAILDFVYSRISTHIVNQSDLTENIWELTTQKEASIIASLRKDSEKLGDICKLGTGIKTGYDNAFVVSKSNAESNKLEKGVLKPWIKNSQIKRYFIQPTNKLVIYTTKAINTKTIPNILQYLNKYKQILSDKNKTRGEDSKWWQLYRPREYLFDMPKEKIMCPYKAKSNSFAYDSTETCGSGDIYVIVPNKNAKFNIKYLLGILNSAPLNFYFSRVGKKKGNLFEYYSEPLAEIPIHILKDPETKLHEKIVQLVDSMLNFNKRLNEIGDKKTDERARIEAEIKKTDAEIDALVYMLYDITEEEKKIIEESLK